MIYEPVDLNARLVELWNARERRTFSGRRILAKAIRAVPGRDFWTPIGQAFTSESCFEVVASNPQEARCAVYRIPLDQIIYDEWELLEYAITLLR